MKSKTLAIATAVAALVAASAAYAQPTTDARAMVPDATAKASCSHKDGCKATDKNSCSTKSGCKAAATQQGKSSCSGKTSCSGKSGCSAK